MLITFQLLIFLFLFAIIALTAKITGKYKTYFCIAIIAGAILLFILASNAHYINIYLGFGILSCISVIVNILRARKKKLAD